VDEQDLALAVLSALRRQAEDPQGDGRGWTVPVTVAHEIGSATEAVLDEFHVLADRGEVELNERAGGIATMARISVKGKARLARLADAKRAAALWPHVRTAKARPGFRYDVFVSHASEDADPFADTLVAELHQRRLRVWYDGERIGHGTAMIDKINDGLRSSRCGVIVASPHYFEKTYTKPELSALLNASMRDEARKVLPVLYQMSQDELFAVHPLLANHINIEAAKHDPSDIARMVAAAVTPQDEARLAEPVALDAAMAVEMRRVRELGASPFAPGMHDAPYDALPEQPHLLAVRPLIQIAWYEPDERDGHPSIAWTLTNVGAAEARDVAVFLPGIASYAAGVLAVGDSKDERRRFDDRYAYHEIMKPPVQAIVEFADVHGNVYREYANVAASFKFRESPADYTTTAFGHPYPVSGRIVQPDIERDRFFLTAPTWDPDAPASPWTGFGL
jgi:TIR domain